MKNATITAMILGTILVGEAFAQSNIDPASKWAWSENCGWTNWQHDAPEPGDGVLVTPTHLAGFVWGENIGWINVGNGDGPYLNDMQDSSTFGVNLDLDSSELSGFAWGENVGWINFNGGAMADPPNPARLEGCRLAGFAWAENIGWINLDDETHFVSLDLDCPADLTGDCDVEAADLAELLGDWGPCDEPCDPGEPATTCSADLTGDCDVEAFDLAILLGSWGTCLE